MKTLLLILLSVFAYCADPIEGKWDFFKEEKIDIKINEGRPLILEGMPEKTCLEFIGGTYTHYRDENIAYKMPYKIISQDGHMINVEIGTAPMVFLVYIYKNDNIIHGRVMGLKNVEYVYKKRG